VEVRSADRLTKEVLGLLRRKWWIVEEKVESEVAGEIREQLRRGLLERVRENKS
jgi:hypothetical protein